MLDRDPTESHPCPTATPCDPRRRHADDAPVPGDQGGASRPSAVLPHGRFLRAVLRRCGQGLGGARHRADQARPASGRRHQDVRRAGAQPRGLPVAPDPPGLQGRRLRAGRGSGRGQEARRQVGGRARRGAGHHARHADRGFAARRAQPQLSRRHRRGAGRAGAGLARPLDRRLRHPAAAAGAACRRRWRGWRPASCWCPTACWRASR